jgi:uncharacterized RDD family membrane protein YckC
VPVEFAGFGPRFGASLIDLGVLLPWILVSLWLHGMSPTAAAVSAVLGVIVTSGYQIGMHAWRGQTVGKAAMDIQVRNADGTTIGFEEAFIRYLPYLANAVISAFGTVLAASAVTETDFLLAGGWMERMRLVNEAEPFWTTFLTTLLGLFSLADVIVFFANRRRRALHDVMAGTVVVHV